MARTINQAGLSIIKSDENLFLKAYYCPAGVLTIGWGHTAGVFPGMQITRDQAIAFLESDLASAEAAVARLVKVPLNDNQFSALVSFTFNEGAGNLEGSTLLKLLNRGFYDQVPTQLARWTRSKGVVLDGLVKRRAAEAALWNAPDGENA